MQTIPEDEPMEKAVEHAEPHIQNAEPTASTPSLSHINTLVPHTKGFLLEDVTVNSQTFGLLAYNRQHYKSLQLLEQNKENNQLWNA